MLQRQTSPSTAQAMWASLALHALIFGCYALTTHLHSRRKPNTQPVIVAKLVAKGPKRPEHLLPRDQAPPQITPTTSPTKSPPSAPPTDNIKSAASRLATMARTQAAMARLREKIEGDPNGQITGETNQADVLPLAQQYAAQISQCLHQHYVIEGVAAAQVAHLNAKVLLFVDGDGQVRRSSILKKSGNTPFDTAVLRAIERCRQLPKPPTALQQLLRQEGLEVLFTPEST